MNGGAPWVYELLPAYHRVRDAEAGYPLRALLGVIGEQVDALEEDIERQYANWFIETCEDWVAPYIGELIGYQPVSTPGLGGFSARAEVANLLGLRRRKGTLALLEELGASVAGWPGRAVEFYARLGWTQPVGHVRLQRGRTADLRDMRALGRLDGAFDTIAHTYDVRRINAARSPGRYAIPNVGLFVWRLKAHPVTRAPACCIETAGSHCYTFSILGNDAPLFAAPIPETEATTIASERNLPVAIRRDALGRVGKGHPPRRSVEPSLYGEGKSIVIVAPDWPQRGAPQPIPAAHIQVADLTGWAHRAPRDTILVDPQLGRFVFPTRQLPRQGAWVDYRSGFPADIGGGEYQRPLAQPAEHLLLKVARDGDDPDTFASINLALAEWRARQDTNGNPRAAVIEIQDSGAYTEPLAIALERGEYLQVRAAQRTRPTIRLLDYMADRPDAFAISGKAGARLVLDGLLIAGRGIRLIGPERNGDANEGEQLPEGDLCDLTIRHSTLVPGWGLTCDCEPRRPGEPSIAVSDSGATIRIEHSIVGAIHVFADERRSDPLRIEASDSVLDATSAELAAVTGVNLPFAFATLRLMRCTVLGQIEAHAIALAENCIFTGRLRIARRQIGCVRFSYVPPGSRTPRRSNCQPDLALDAADAGARGAAEARVRPSFTSIRYGNPAYAQLGAHCPPEIAGGADDEAEMGVYHDLYQPQRTAALRARLSEFSPSQTDTDVIFVN